MLYKFMEKKYSKIRLQLKIMVFNPIKDWGEGVFDQARGFLPITLEVIKVHRRNLVIIPRI